jgi:hypothetical protein
VDEESTAHESLPEGIPDGLDTVRREQRVGVEEDKARGSCGRGPCVQLQPATPATADDQGPGLPGQRHRPVAAPAVANHDLVSYSNDPRQMATESFLFIEGGDDCGDRRGVQNPGMLA